MPKVLSLDFARQVEVRARAAGGGGAYLAGTVSAATANGTAAFTALRVNPLNPKHETLDTRHQTLNTRH